MLQLWHKDLFDDGLFDDDAKRTWMNWIWGFKISGLMNDCPGNPRV